MRGLRDQIQEGATRRFLEKRGFAGAFGVGLSLPETLDRAKARHDDVVHGVNAAQSQNADVGLAAAKHAAQLSLPGMGGMGASLQSLMHQAGSSASEGAMGGFGKSVGGLAGLPLGVLATGLGGALSDKLKGSLNPKAFGEKKDPLHMAASSAASSFGSALGAAGLDLLKDMAAKAMSAASSAGDQSARMAILQQLKHEDMVLSQADDKVLMEAFHTMTRFAPVLSTDKNMVRSFLRTSVMSGAGPDFTTIRLLADSERAVNGERGK